MGVCLGVGAGLAIGPSLPDELRMVGVAMFMFAAVYFYYRQAPIGIEENFRVKLQDFKFLQRHCDRAHLDPGVRIRKSDRNPSSAEAIT